VVRFLIDKKIEDLVCFFYILEIDDGEDENIEPDDDFLAKLKGKVPDQEMSGDGLGENNGNDEDDDSDFDIDETDLESYSTVLEANEDIDEFQIFCESLQRKYEIKKKIFLFIYFLLF
jgi:hypothetical protein